VVTSSFLPTCNYGKNQPTGLIFDFFYQKYKNKKALNGKLPPIFLFENQSLVFLSNQKKSKSGA